MESKQSPYEPIELHGEVTHARQMLRSIHWYVLGSAVMFVVTVCSVTTALPFLLQMAATGFVYMAFVLIAFRTRNSGYSLTALVVVLVGFGLGGEQTFPGEWWGILPCFGTALLFPFLLMWIGREWVFQFCRLEGEPVQNS